MCARAMGIWLHKLGSQMQFSSFLSLLPNLIYFELYKHTRFEIFINYDYLKPCNSSAGLIIIMNNIITVISKNKSSFALCRFFCMIYMKVILLDHVSLS